MNERARRFATLLATLAYPGLVACIDDVVIASYPGSPEEAERTLQHCDPGTARVAWSVDLDEVLDCDDCAFQADVRLWGAPGAVLVSRSGGWEPLAVTAALGSGGELRWRHSPAHEPSTETGDFVQRVTLSREDDAHVARFSGVEYRCVEHGCRGPATLPPSRVEVIEIETGEIVESLVFDEPADRVLALAGGVWVRTKAERLLDEPLELGSGIATLVSVLAGTEDPWTRRFEYELVHALASPDGELVFSQGSPPRVFRMDAAGEIVFDDEGALWPPYPVAPRSLSWSESGAPQLAGDDAGHTLATRSTSVDVNSETRTHVLLRKYARSGEILWHRVVTSLGTLDEPRAILSDEHALLALAQREGEMLRNQVLRVDAEGRQCTRFTIADPAHLWAPGDPYAGPSPGLVRELAAGPDGAVYFRTGRQVGRIVLDSPRPRP